MNQPDFDAKRSSVDALAAIGVRVERPAGDACGSGEVFALRVLGTAMLPEFEEGDIIVVEPEGLATSGSFVVAQCAGEWHFRQLQRDAAGWFLVALDATLPVLRLDSLAAVRGVVIQKSKPGRRSGSKRYVD